AATPEFRSLAACWRERDLQACDPFPMTGAPMTRTLPRARQLGSQRTEDRENNLVMMRSVLELASDLEVCGLRGKNWVGVIDCIDRSFRNCIFIKK
ncbi:MAG TPA: hypothetical protein VK508_21605, partial [Cyclobacteriaceae bacterium]|nr:hypothetical protein [Cyclobacteriaceae bacterium]